MSEQTEVTIDYDHARIIWGKADPSYDPVEFVLNIRNLSIECVIQGHATLNKSAIRAGLQRSLKYFVRDGQLWPWVQYKKTVLYRMANYTDVPVTQWAARVKPDFDDSSHFNIWINIARPNEMLVMDNHNETSIVTNSCASLQNKPTALEFVRSEGGVLFNHHELGLDARTHQAEAGLKIRRDMARRTRGSGHYATFGLLNIVPINATSTELWVGEDRLWTVHDREGTRCLTPNSEHFSDWDASFAISDPAACQRMADFTFSQMQLID